MRKSIAIIGAGPAGLYAAERLAPHHNVTIYERKPSVGRKFLMAGRGGLNLTHSEDIETFVTRYGTARKHIESFIRAFPPADLIQWCEGLGQPTFVGSSGRIFPKSMKASPLLRAWLARLESLGVEFKMWQEWRGWNSSGDLLFSSSTVKPDATLLALGGATWPALGSDGSWYSILKSKNIPLTPFAPANCGYNVAWSEIFRDKFAGTPLKSIALTFDGKTIPGEIMITRHGVEGGLIYAFSAQLRAATDRQITLDLNPGLTYEQLLKKLSTPRGRKSFSTYMHDILPPVATSLLRETNRNIQDLPIYDLAMLIKNLPLTLGEPFALDRAISTAGGVQFSALDENLMLKNLPGVFVAGEMLDWEAPTGGYLLQGCFATGNKAANGILAMLNKIS